MFDIHCPVCDRRYLMSESSIQHLHNTEDGPVAHLSCYAGHQLVRYFRADVSRTEPAPVLGNAAVALVDAAKTAA